MTNRPITLFTGQWADLPLEEVAKLASDWGYDGLELACWGDHFEVDRAINEEGYVEGQRELLKKYDLDCWVISNHLVGQAVCDSPIDERHKNILPARIWGDGDPEGVRQRAEQEMIDTGRAARKFGVDIVVGFTGSSIWHTIAGFPPVPEAMIDAGYQDFADRWGRIMDVYAEEKVKFALEVHPTEVAFDTWSTHRTLEALDHPNFGINFDPSHFVWQFLDVPDFIRTFKDKIFHVDCKDAKKRLDGRNGVMASHLPFGNMSRGWDFISVGHGDVPWEDMIRMLNEVGYDGPISIEWEDAGMDRLVGAPEALEYISKLLWDVPEGSFDDAFASED